VVVEAGALTNRPYRPCLIVLVLGLFLPVYFFGIQKFLTLVLSGKREEKMSVCESIEVMRVRRMGESLE
jgi:hypothetical protein